MNERMQNKFYDEIEKRFPYKNYEVTGEYIRSDRLIEVTDEHGKCLIKPTDLLKGHCPSIKSAVDKTSYWINEVSVVHKNFYIYDKFEYIGGNIKSIITCSIHGDFKQTPSSHKSGQGCPICSLNNRGASKNKFKERGANKQSIFYIIKCSDESEEFYKVGIATTSLKKRYDSYKKMPYKMETILEIKSENPGYIWDIEQKAKNELKNFLYKPLKSFNGKTECFSINPVTLLNFC